MNVHYYVQSVPEKLNMMFQLFSHISNCELTASQEDLLLIMTPNERLKTTTSEQIEDTTVAVRRDLPVSNLTPNEQTSTLGEY